MSALTPEHPDVLQELGKRFSPDAFQFPPPVLMPLYVLVDEPVLKHLDYLRLIARRHFGQLGGLHGDA